MLRAKAELLRSHFWLVMLISGIGLGLVIFWLTQVIPPFHIDFQVYRLGVEAWWQDKDIYRDLPFVQVDTGDFPLPWVYPPFALPVLAPFAVLPFGAAIALIYVLDFLALGATIYVIARRIWPAIGARGALMIASTTLPLTVFLEPIKANFHYGQISIILMAVVVVDCLAPKTWWPRGMGLGLIAAVKLTPLVFLLFFLLRKDFRATTVTVITTIVATLIGFAIDWHASIGFWFGGIMGEAGNSGSVFRNNQSIEAVLIRAGLSDGMVKVMWFVLVIALLALVILVARKVKPVPALLLVAGFSLLVSPTSWSHYWVWFIPALVVMADCVIRKWQEHRAAALGWLAAIFGTILMCVLSPFLFVPLVNFRVEPIQHDWTLSSQLLCASYVLLGLALFLAYAIPQISKSRKARSDSSLAVAERDNPAELVKTENP